MVALDYDLTSPDDIIGGAKIPITKRIIPDDLKISRSEPDENNI